MRAKFAKIGIEAGKPFPTAKLRPEQKAEIETGIKSALEKRSGRKVAEVSSSERPVPLDFEYRETPLHETLEELLDTKQAPIYVVHFTKAAAPKRARARADGNVCRTAHR